MKKFKFLISNSLTTKLKSKAFIISMIITSLLIIILSVVPAIIERTSSDEVFQANVILAETTDSDIEGYISSEFSLLGDLNITNDLAYDAFSFWEDENVDVLIVFISPDGTNTLADVEDVLYYSKLKGTENDMLKAIVSSTKSAMLINHVDYLINLDVKVDPDSDPLDPDLGFSPELMGISTMFFVVIFMFIIMSTQSLGAEILEEKSTKAIETIISSVPAEQHFFAKIISSVVFTAIQLAIFLVAGLVGSFIGTLLSPSGTSITDLFVTFNGSSSSNLALTLIIGVIVLILGLILYLMLFAFFASFANNNEEYQKAQSPMMIVLLIIFYGSMFLAGSQQLGLIKGLSYIPFFTPFLLPIAMLMGSVSILEIILIIGIIVLFIILLTYFLLPAYKVSILSYSSDKLFKEIKRSLKTARQNRKISRRNNGNK